MCGGPPVYLGTSLSTTTRRVENYQDQWWLSEHSLPILTVPCLSSRQFVATTTILREQAGPHKRLLVRTYYLVQFRSQTRRILNHTHVLHTWSIMKARGDIYSLDIIFSSCNVVYLLQQEHYLLERRPLGGGSLALLYHQRRGGHQRRRSRKNQCLRTRKVSWRVGGSIVC